MDIEKLIAVARDYLDDAMEMGECSGKSHDLRRNHRMIDGSELGAKIRRYRKMRGWTRTDLANKAVCSEQTIQKLETGGFPRADILLDVLRALGMGLDDLLGLPDRGQNAEDQMARLLEDVAGLQPCQICAWVQNGRCENPKKRVKPCFRWRGLGRV